jgi:hypothetical protein
LDLEAEGLQTHDEKTMVATTSGFDSQPRQFKMHAVWDRL